MHDISAARKILRLATTLARELGYQEVKVVRARVGAWAFHGEDGLRHAFANESSRTIAAGARLEIETVHPVCQCRDCGAEFLQSTFSLTCVSCGSRRVALQQDNDVEITSIEA